MALPFRKGKAGHATSYRSRCFSFDIVLGKVYTYSTNGEAGPKSTKLYNTLRAIQYGDIEDKHGWVTFVE